jgi:UDP:flavonoid glycosyltransferase YjiC (YdhE family)
VPFLVDQPFWAERLHRLGVAPPPLPVGELTAEALAAAIRSCLERPSYRAQAAHLGRRIRAEDGPGAVRSLVTQLPGTG